MKKKERLAAPVEIRSYIYMTGKMREERNGSHLFSRYDKIEKIRIGEAVMEKLLTKLFDYQKFENNPKLSAVISGVEEKYSLQEKRRMLSEEELGLVSAAKGIQLTDSKIVMDSYCTTFNPSNPNGNG